MSAKEKLNQLSDTDLKKMYDEIVTAERVGTLAEDSSVRSFVNEYYTAANHGDLFMFSLIACTKDVLLEIATRHYSSEVLKLGENQVEHKPDDTSSDPFKRVFGIDSSKG